MNRARHLYAVESKGTEELPDLGPIAEPSQQRWLYHYWCSACENHQSGFTDYSDVWRAFQHVVMCPGEQDPYCVGGTQVEVDPAAADSQMSINWAHSQA